MSSFLDSEDVALDNAALLVRLHGHAVFAHGDPTKFGHTVTYDFDDYIDACIYAEIVRGRGNAHGEPCLWPTGKIRLVVTKAHDDPTDNS